MAAPKARVVRRKRRASLPNPVKLRRYRLRAVPTGAGD